MLDTLPDAASRRRLLGGASFAALATGAAPGALPPAGSEGAVLIAADTNAARPGKRLYMYAAGGWNYVDLR